MSSSIVAFPPTIPPAPSAGEGLCPHCGGPLARVVTNLRAATVGVVCQSGWQAAWLPDELCHPCGAPNDEGRTFLLWHDAQLAKEEVRHAA